MKYQESAVFGETPTTTLYKVHLKKVREVCAPEQIPDYLGESLKAWTTTTTSVEKIKTQNPIMVLGTAVKPSMVTKLALVVGIAVVRVIQQWIMGKSPAEEEAEEAQGSGAGGSGEAENSGE